jgi:hypothetical protein
MNFLKFKFLFFIFTFVLKLNAQKHLVEGIVSNSANEPIAFVSVSIEEKPGFGTSTDIKGHYQLKLDEGSYTFVFSFLGYRTVKLPVIINHKSNHLKHNIILEQEDAEFSGVKISIKKIDNSEEVIKNVINHKYKYLYQSPFSSEAYIKAVELNDLSNQKKSQKIDSNNNKSFNIAEIYLKVYLSSPNKIKEIRNGVKTIGSTEGLFFLSHTDGDFNFYKNLIEVPALSEMPFLSPISNSGLYAYKFKLLQTYTDSNFKYYRIKVTPALLGNALFQGELTIVDSIWAIKSLKLTMPKYHMTEYDFFEVQQSYYLDSGRSYLESMRFNYHSKSGKNIKSGVTEVFYSNYQFDLAVNKKFFGNEISKTEQEAYERDTSYWSQLRTSPFSNEEIAFIRKNDSIEAIVNQKEWRDSVDRIYNKLTYKKLLFFGQGNYKRSVERTWFFKPLIFSYLPFYIAGPRFDYWVNYSKEYKNKKDFNIFVRANYGTLNNDLKGNVDISRLYNPFKRASYSIRLGSDFGVINGFESWVRLFARSNFYIHDYVSFNHRKEIINGLYIGAGGEYSNRKSVSGLKFDSRGDSLWGGNSQIIDFSFYQALYFNMYIGFVPFQKYIREPFQKLILGSKWPEVFMRYRKGLPVLGSVVDFDYLEFGMEQDIKVGLVGNSKFRIVSGEFLSSKDLRIVDFKFQRRAGPIFFSNPMYSFQGIDTTYNTIKRFYEAHYFHRFNGAIINKIPILKKLNIIEVAGGGFLYTHERNFKYIEGFVGIEKVIRLWNERFKIGVFVVGAKSNLYNYLPQFKFTIETYDKVGNRWPY